MADSESAALTGLGDTPVPGAVGETRTLMTLATATSRLRVYQFRHDRMSDFSARLCALRTAILSKTAEIANVENSPLKHRADHSARTNGCLAGVVGFEPTNGGFRIRCLNRTWRYPSAWCGRRDSNSHDSRHSHLKAARLPISPRPQEGSQFCSSRHLPDQRRAVF